jgi:hypothetical protein
VHDSPDQTVVVTSTSWHRQQQLVCAAPRLIARFKTSECARTYDADGTRSVIAGAISGARARGSLSFGKGVEEITGERDDTVIVRSGRQDKNPTIPLLVAARLRGWLLRGQIRVGIMRAHGVSCHGPYSTHHGTRKAILGRAVRPSLRRNPLYVHTLLERNNEVRFILF